VGHAIPDRLPAGALDPADRRALQALLERRGLRPSRSRGQHFLVSPAVLDAVVDAAELGRDDSVVEIGAGLGPLTVRLAARAGRIVAYEVDPLIAAVLREEVLGDIANVRVVQADVLSVDLLAGSPTRVVANLPYQITSPVLERLLGDRRRPPLAVLMVQQEVAERLTGTSRSFITIFAQAFAEIDLVRRVSPRAFMPPPRVASAVVRMRARPEPLFAPYPQGDFLRLVSDAFRHRRKTLVAALGFEAALERAVAAEVVRASGLPDRARPEELEVTDWRTLYAALASRGLRRA
jgi:16S rRNA (adenine1518-N6/adenine1519-N6)-dimethyltransferase